LVYPLISESPTKHGRSNEGRSGDIRELGVRDASVDEILSEFGQELSHF
jgi:hypothetical protein